MDVSVTPPAVTRVRLVRAGARLWRVARPDGLVIGHLGVRGDAADRRFHALRYRPGHHGFAEIGAFWTAQEAVDCLRLSR